MQDTENIIFEFSKQQYEFELEQQNVLNSYISIPIGIITVIAGSLSYIFTDPPIWWSNGKFTAFFIFYILSILSVVLTIVYIFLHQTGLKYKRVPSPEEIKRYSEDYKKANKDLKELDSFLKSALENVLYTHYRECADVNFKNNLKKSYYFRVIKVLVMVSIVFAAISYGIYSFVDKPEKVNTIRIENLKELNMADDKDQGASATSQPPASPSTQVQTTPVEVPIPTARIVTESFDPKNLVIKDSPAKK